MADPVKVMLSARHSNDGNCAKCDQIFNRYPGFNVMLRSWFKALQAKNPEAHISCASRGELDQEAAFIHKVSRAEWGASAHNYGAAIDIFCLIPGDLTNIYPRDWYTKVVQPALDSSLAWYGAPNSPYPELPHVELKNWRSLVKAGVLQLCEQGH